MPAVKGRRGVQKKEDAVEDAIVPENDDNISVEDAPTSTKPKGGRPGMKKGKAADSKSEMEEDDSENNDKGEEDVAEKSGPKARGKGAAKKPSAKDDSEEPMPNKKAPKRGNAVSGDEAVKPKKAGKKEETLPTRRGGDRAAKKPISYEDEEKVSAAKKGRATKAKNGVTKVAAKDKRGRGGKKVAAAAEDVESDEMETAEDSETAATTVSVEH